MIKASIFIIFPTSKFYSNKASQSCNSFRSENTFLGDSTGTSLWQDSFVLGTTAWSLQRTRRCLSLNPGHPTTTQICDPLHHATFLQQAVRAARNAQPETVLQRQSPRYTPPNQEARFPRAPQGGRGRRVRPRVRGAGAARCAAAGPTGSCSTPSRLPPPRCVEPPSQELHLPPCAAAPILRTRSLVLPHRPGGTH